MSCDVNNIIVDAQIALSIPVPPPVVEADPNAVKIKGTDVIIYDVMCYVYVCMYVWLCVRVCMYRWKVHKMSG